MNVGNNIKEISDLAHEAESHLDLAIKNNSYSEKTSEYVLKLKREINSFLETHDGILQHKDSIDSKQINIFDLKTFHSQLSDHFAQDFEKKFLHSPIKPYFQIYPQLVHDLAEKNNKKTNSVKKITKNAIHFVIWKIIYKILKI